jgi:hypothetical protein
MAARARGTMLDNEARRTIWDAETSWLPAMPRQIGALMLHESDVPHEADDGETIVRGLE